MGQLPCLEIASSVTSYGRYLLESTKKFVEKKYSVSNGYPFNAEVIYGDTGRYLRSEIPYWFDIHAASDMVIFAMLAKIPSWSSSAQELFMRHFLLHWKPQKNVLKFFHHRFA